MSDSFKLTAFATPAPEEGNDRVPLALAVGLVMALVAGGVWALIGFVTHMEIGYVAWGIGLLVGVAMTRVTQARSQQLAYTAAAFAVLGLLAGKIFIFAGGSGQLASQLASDDEALTFAVARQLYEARELTPATLEELDRNTASGDTLSEAVQDSLLSQASIRLTTMTAEEKQQAAASLARGMMQELGVVGGVRAQLSLFDLLWLFLAVGTAYRMLAPSSTQDVPEMQHA